MTAREGSAAFVAPLLVLALGHMISNLLRTLPAISADLLAADIGTTADGLAALAFLAVAALACTVGFVVTTRGQGGAAPLDPPLG